jgi:hypothetical protein
MSNLPSNTDTDSSQEVRSFFNSYFTEEISFPAADIDATVGFFEKRGFDKTASQSTAIILLQQAKIDNVNIFDLLDTLEGLTELQMSAIVTQVLNYNRQKTSTLGYRAETTGDFFERRNILV